MRESRSMLGRLGGLLALACLATGCGKEYVILQPPTEPLANFGCVILGRFSTDRFMAHFKGRSFYGKYLKLANMANRDVWLGAKNRLNRVPVRPGRPCLVVSAEMQDLYISNMFADLSLGILRDQISSDDWSGAVHKSGLATDILSVIWPWPRSTGPSPNGTLTYRMTVSCNGRIVATFSVNRPIYGGPWELRTLDDIQGVSDRIGSDIVQFLVDKQ